MASVPFCPGEVVDVMGVAECHDDMGAPLAWESAPTFTIEEVDPTVASAAFAGGFVIVGTAWAIGRGVRVVLSMLK